MNIKIRKLQKFLERLPSITSCVEYEVEELVGEINRKATTTETNSTIINTTLSIPSQFPDETFPADDPAHTIMRIVHRNCKKVSKATSLVDLFNHLFVESDPQLEAIYQ